MTLLVLAGTGEARDLCRALQGRDVVASLAGAVAKPAALGVETRVGGFGGEAGFRVFLVEAGISAVVDATHPFAARITARTVAVCGELGLPYLRLERPGWTPGPGDDWVMVPDEAAVRRHVGPGDIVFLATGRQTLERFAGLGAKRVYCRQIDPPEGAFPFAGGDYVIGRPPFSVADEVDLFRRLAVTRLVVKNAGGAASRSKLEAARQLGIRVIMLEPPEGPVCARVETVDAALDWALAHLEGGVDERVILGPSCVAEGAEWLVRAEPRFRAVLEAVPVLPLRLKPDGFAELLSAIVSQQVSVASARAIWARVAAAGLVTPEAVRAATDEDLRGVGLSRPKMRYARALAEAGIDYDALRDARQRRLSHGLWR